MSDLEAEVARTIAAVGPGVRPSPQSGVIACDVDGKAYDPETHKTRKDGTPAMMALKEPGDYGETHRLLKMSAAEKASAKRKAKKKGEAGPVGRVVDPTKGGVGGEVPPGVGPGVGGAQGGVPPGGPPPPGGAAEGASEHHLQVPNPPERDLALTAVHLLEEAGKAACRPPGEFKPYDGSMHPAEKQMLSTSLEQWCRERGITQIPTEVSIIAILWGYQRRIVSTEHGAASWKRFRGEKPEGGENDGPGSADPDPGSTGDRKESAS